MIDWTEAELARLAEQKVVKGPDGSLRRESGAPVGDGLACRLLGYEAGAHPVNPADYQRPYLQPGHSANSPANRSAAMPVPPPDPATGGRSATPPDAGDGVEKVAPDRSRADVVDWAAALASESERFGGPAGPVPTPHFDVVEPENADRGYLQPGHASASPGDQPGNNPAPPLTGSGHEVYRAGREAYSANRAANCSDHVSPTGACVSQPAPAQYSPPAGMQANAVPRPVNPSRYSGHAPGER